MNALCTLNLRSFLPAQARESFQAAAARWGVAYVEITTPLLDCHAFWQKAFVPTSPHVAAFDRVLQLDGDMLIRSDCPNPFDLVPPDNFGVVSRMQRGVGLAKGRRTFEERKPRFAEAMGLTPYAEPQQHLNAGLLLYSPQRHAELLQAWQESGRHCKWSTRCPVPEQFALSCLLQSMHIPTTWLHWHYNTIRTLRRWVGRAGPMRTFIYHFNGPHGRNLPAIMERVQWKLPTES